MGKKILRVADIWNGIFILNIAPYDIGAIYQTFFDVVVIIKIWRLHSFLRRVIHLWQIRLTSYINKARTSIRDTCRPHLPTAREKNVINNRQMTARK